MDEDNRREVNHDACCKYLIIPPDNYYKTIWNAIYLFIVSIYQTYVIFFVATGQPHDEDVHFKILVFALDIGIFIDMLLSFATDEYFEAGMKPSQW